MTGDVMRGETGRLHWRAEDCRRGPFPCQQLPDPFGKLAAQLPHLHSWPKPAEPLSFGSPLWVQRCACGATRLCYFLASDGAPRTTVEWA
jgi:hypothetical protein